jgi:hypothetical protein
LSYKPVLLGGAAHFRLQVEMEEGLVSQRGTVSHRPVLVKQELIELGFELPADSQQTDIDARKRGAYNPGKLGAPPHRPDADLLATQLAEALSARANEFALDSHLLVPRGPR